MHVIAALLLAVHGIAHLVGVRSAFWPSPIEATRRSYLRRKVDGVMWLLLTFGFLGCAALLLLHQDAWTALLLWSVAGSFVLCLLSWPEARIGLLINVVLFLLVLLLTPGNRAPFLVTRARGAEMASPLAAAPKAELVDAASVAGLPAHYLRFIGATRHRDRSERSKGVCA